MDKSKGSVAIMAGAGLTESNVREIESLHIYFLHEFSTVRFVLLWIKLGLMLSMEASEV